MKQRMLILGGMLILGVVLLASGCTRQEESGQRQRIPVEQQIPEQSDAEQGNLRASAAYLKYFGPPPQVKDGATCYALVGYAPAAGQQGRIRPFPLFLLDADNQMQIVVEQLLQWTDGWSGADKRANPFPEETELLGLSQNQDLVRVELGMPAKALANPSVVPIMVGLLAHALTQFDGVERVMVVVNGTLLPLQAERGFLPDMALVVAPSAPKVLAVVGNWEGEGRATAEVSVFLDRPVSVDSLQVRSADQQTLEGEMFQSLFNMAVVIRPQQPLDLREGAPLGVQWKVTDALGRTGQGEGTFLLSRVQ